MLSTHWVLLWSFLFYDGHVVNHQETYYKKEYCLETAKVRWSEYYKNEMDTVSSFWSICRNEKNHYDFVKVICDRNGNCNI
jgi:hypothetical protein